MIEGGGGTESLLVSHRHVGKVGRTGESLTSRYIECFVVRSENKLAK